MATCPAESSAKGVGTVKFPACFVARRIMEMFASRSRIMEEVRRTVMNITPATKCFRVWYCG